MGETEQNTGTMPKIDREWLPWQEKCILKKGKTSVRQQSEGTGNSPKKAVTKMFKLMMSQTQKPQTWTAISWILCATYCASNGPFVQYQQSKLSAYLRKKYKATDTHLETGKLLEKAAIQQGRTLAHKGRMTQLAHTTVSMNNIDSHWVSPEHGIGEQIRGCWLRGAKVLAPYLAWRREHGRIVLHSGCPLRIWPSTYFSSEVCFKPYKHWCFVNTQRTHIRQKTLEKKRIYARQTVMLTGLSLETFAKAIANLDEAFAMMRSPFPDELVSSWQPTMYEGHVTVDIHTRYFTIWKSAPNEKNLPFMNGIDPDKVLLTLRRHDLIHGPDNRVTYLKIMTESENQMKYMQLFGQDPCSPYISYNLVNPTLFQIGDIIEACFAFVILPIRDNKYVAVPQLRSLMLLDDEPCKVFP